VLVVSGWFLANAAKAENASALASSERRGLVVTGMARPARIQVVVSGSGPARAEMERAVRGLVGALPELSWTEGRVGPTTKINEISQVLVDVSDPGRIRIVSTRAPDSAQPARPATPPVVRVVGTASLSPDVARETVAQIVQTMVRAWLDPGVDLRGPAREPPPPAPSPVDAAVQSRIAANAGKPPDAKPPAPVYSAALSICEHTFPFALSPPSGSDQMIGGVALSLGRRRGALSTVARLSGEWGQRPVSAIVIGTQIVTASAGVSARLSVGRAAITMAAEAGAVVMHQRSSMQYEVSPGGVPLVLPGVLGSSWSAGPMAGPRWQVAIDVSSHLFLQLEGGVPVVFLKVADINGNSAWHFDVYSQVMLGAGYYL
jgi:hypothetical protein